MANWTFSAKGQDFTQDTYEKERGEDIDKSIRPHVGAKLMRGVGRQLGLNTCLHFSRVVWFVTPHAETVVSSSVVRVWARVFLAGNPHLCLLPQTITKQHPSSFVPFPTVSHMQCFFLLYAE